MLDTTKITPVPRRLRDLISQLEFCRTMAAGDSHETEFGTTRMTQLEALDQAREMVRRYIGDDYRAAIAKATGGAA